jgi:DEAD/DEAH box helicase domain-containing protein
VRAVPVWCLWPCERCLCRGIKEFFKHQAVAIDAIAEGKHVVMSTSTSSGKSLVFCAPVFDHLLRHKTGVAMFMFPTKALAQDQLRALNEFMDGSPALREVVRPSVFDGDAGAPDREFARAEANVLLLNPDILHATLLPRHKMWERVFSQLVFVVLDEAHTYRGLFGSHVAMVLRRLLRLCARYGSSPRFVCCSATIANPAEHFCNLVGIAHPPELSRVSLGGPGLAIAPLSGRYGVTDTEGGRVVSTLAHPQTSTKEPVVSADEPLMTDHGSFVVVSRDLSASGSRKFIMWNPPHIEDLMEKNAVEVQEWSGKALSEVQEARRVLKRARGTASSATSSAKRSKATTTTEHEDTSEEATPQEMIRGDGGTSDDDGVVARVSGLRDRSRSAARGWEALLGRHKAVVREPAKALRWDDGACWPSMTAQEGDVVARLSSLPEMDSIPLDAPAGVMIAPPSSWADREDPEQAVHRRKSSIVEAAAMMASLVQGGMRTILFCKIRRVAELALQYAHERLSANAPDLIRKVKSYRGGYLKTHRRAIERELFDGRLLGVVATNALELGVDIGSLDCVIILGYPGSAASLWQQAGRAGRGGRDAVAILIAFPSPLDQFFVRDPAALVSKRPEACLIDVANPNVLRSHAICAAFEAPLCGWDLSLFGPSLGSIVALLRGQSILSKVNLSEDDPGFGRLDRSTALGGDSRSGCWRLAPWVTQPHDSVSLRAAGQRKVVVVDVGNDNRVVDEVDYFNAIWEVYEGAIYMNQGVTYRVSGSPGWGSELC